MIRPIFTYIRYMLISPFFYRTQEKYQSWLQLHPLLVPVKCIPDNLLASGTPQSSRSALSMPNTKFSLQKQTFVILRKSTQKHTGYAAGIWQKSRKHSVMTSVRKLLRCDTITQIFFLLYSIHILLKNTLQQDEAYSFFVLWSYDFCLFVSM